jgi:hypothetical protein
LKPDRMAQADRMKGWTDMKAKVMVPRRVAFATLLLFALAVFANAQTERERERELNDREIELRSWNLKILSLSANKQPKPKMRPEQALAQVQEDFARIQMVNKTLVFSISDKRPLDFRFVTRSVTEIRKRSERLNENLALPEFDKTAIETPPAVASPTQLKLSVLRLGNLIYSFTNNPFFKEPSVIDTEQTLKARRELLEIVELSAQIKKDSERLEKAGP